MADLSIGEVARRSGLSASAIRYYERRGLLAAPPRRHARRCYDPAILKRLRAVAKARSAGLGLGAIETLLGSTATRAAFDRAVAGEIEAVERRMAKLAKLKAGLERMARCGCVSPSDCAMAF